MSVWVKQLVKVASTFPRFVLICDFGL